MLVFVTLGKSILASVYLFYSKIYNNPIMTNTTNRSDIRNIAIIAHVDHGKTTLVDQMFKQGGQFRENEVVSERLMDNLDLEKERGITITAKNCAINWNGTKINIVDTPGHADFGGEVERALSMVDGVVLLVDSSEGPLPQTRFVLRKALALQLPIIVLLNKIDRKDARCEEVLNEVYDLFIDLDANDKQIEFPILYAIGRDGIAKNSLAEEGKNLTPLFEKILETIPGPKVHSGAFEMLVSNVGYSDFLGRLAIGLVRAGTLTKNMTVKCLKSDDTTKNVRVTKIQVFDGVSLAEVQEAKAGDIVILAGVEDVEIGDTLSASEQPKALPRPVVDEPTLSMRFYANTSPFSGKEGKYVLATKIGERLQKECLYNVALKVENSTQDESFIVMGRGEFQMVILIETMRREGFELCVGRPEIIYKMKDGEKTEPIEHVSIDCEEQFVGVLTEKLSQRKGRMVNLTNNGFGRVRLEFSVPSRGLLGFRSEFLTDTKGSGLLHSYVSGYEPYRGDFKLRQTGSLVSDRVGTTVAYALFNLEPRGIMMVGHGEDVYNGMVIGEHNRDNDLLVNPTKAKKLTNIRAAGKDENIVLTPVTPLTLEKAIDFIREDELVEVTPKNIRIRKRVLPIARGD
jgi:GTP-binding protein